MYCGARAQVIQPRAPVWFRLHRIGHLTDNRVIEHVSTPWHRADQLEAAFPKGATYIRDAVRQRVVGDDGSFPDSVVQLVLGDELAPIFKQYTEDGEGLWTQVNLVLTAIQRATVEIESEITESVHAMGVFTR